MPFYVASLEAPLAALVPIIPRNVCGLSAQYTSGVASYFALITCSQVAVMQKASIASRIERAQI
jgi:hypothetical protein